MLILYLFLLEVVRAVWRDLNAPARRTGTGAARANLQIVQPAAARLKPGEIVVLRGATTIGRERGNDVVVDEETVSSRHARLLPRDGNWWIEDLGSRNGTLVNDAQVDGAAALRPGDLIQVGRVQLRFNT